MKNYCNPPYKSLDTDTREFWILKDLSYLDGTTNNEKSKPWEVLMLVDSEVAAWVSGAAETVDYFG